MERTYRQVTCKRDIAGPGFTRGVIDVDFSIGGKTTWNPSRSYFRIGVEINGAPGADSAGNATTRTVPKYEEFLALANFCPGNLFDNCFFYAGGQNVSSIVNYAPQAHALGYRLKKSAAWMKSIGKDAYGIHEKFGYRVGQVSSGTVIPALSEATYDPNSLDSTAKNMVYFMYQPPLGIMDHDKPMGSGDYRFQFNPNTNYKNSCVESNNNRTQGTDFDFNVTSMELYICTEKMDVSPTGTDVLHLMEHQVQSKPVRAGEGNFDFTIPSSTKAISIFVQGGTAGTDNRIPPSMFTTTGLRNELTLQSLQVTYAGLTKPPTRWTSEFGTNTEKMQQRYLDTQIESSQAFSPGGCEPYADWKGNGPVYHYSWIRDANDRSTQVQIQANFQTMADNNNLFIVSHYTKSVEISVENGFVAEVKSLTI
jgi:hypothetical protein